MQVRFAEADLLHCIGRSVLPERTLVFIVLFIFPL